MRTSINSRGPGFVTAAPPPCALHAARSGQTQAAPEVRAGRARAQAADVGVGIMGKEGRQAVNNSDYAVSQFRFLTRLLLLHGSLSAYRLSRLIKYSFYKNIAFGGMLFFFQFYCGFSGQARSRPPKRGVAWSSKGAVPKRSRVVRGHALCGSRASGEAVTPAAVPQRGEPGGEPGASWAVRVRVATLCP